MSWRHVISRLFNKFVFFFIQLSCSTTNIPAWTLSLNQLIAIWGLLIAISRVEACPSSSPAFRSSCSQIFFKKGVLKNFAKFTGKRLCQNPFFNNVAGLRLHRCFPVIFAKFLRTLFSRTHPVAASEHLK